jgi:replication factor C large subunit
MELWVDRYRPKKLSEVLSQHKPLEDTQTFLHSWKPGKALMYSGPPGTGKTLMAELVARERGWMLTAINASDERNAEAIETTLQESSKNMGLFSKGRLILIDEVDGLGAGDRGGVNAIVKVIKDSRFPVILIANDPYIQKLQPLRQASQIVKFSRVNVLSIEKRLREICAAEGIAPEGDVLKNLARWSSGDMRSAITDLQNASQGKMSISDFDLQVVGHREREADIFSILPAIFRSKSVRAAKKVMWECDKDPDDIFWWIEANIQSQFSTAEGVAKAFDMLSRADMYRHKVMVQQNWAFKGYMVDMMSGISLSGDNREGFVPFRPPDKLIQMGATRQRREQINSVCERFGAYVHTSRKVVKRDYLPLLRQLLKEKGIRIPKETGLTEEDVKVIAAAAE